MPHMAVYFVLDCSGTMVGDKIASVKRGVAKICEALNCDPRSRDTIQVSVIWFNDAAHRTPMRPIGAFRLPDELQPLGKTRLGAALQELNAALDHDVAENDYRPLVFLMTDGKPTDVWQDQADRYRARLLQVPLHTFGLAIGRDADTEVISAIADIVMSIDEVTADSLEGYFDWVSESVTAVSASQSQLIDSRRTITLPPVPSTITLNRDITGAIRSKRESPTK